MGSTARGVGQATGYGGICAGPYDCLTDSQDPCLVDLIMNLGNTVRLVHPGITPPNTQFNFQSC